MAESSTTSCKQWKQDGQTVKLLSSLSTPLHLSWMNSSAGPSTASGCWQAQVLGMGQAATPSQCVPTRTVRNYWVVAVAGSLFIFICLFFCLIQKQNGCVSRIQFDNKLKAYLIMVVFL